MLNRLILAIFSSRVILGETSKLLIQIQYFLYFVPVEHDFRLLYYTFHTPKIIRLRHCPRLISNFLARIQRRSRLRYITIDLSFFDFDQVFYLAAVSVYLVQIFLGLAVIFPIESIEIYQSVSFLGLKLIFEQIFSVDLPFKRLYLQIAAQMIIILIDEFELIEISVVKGAEGSIHILHHFLLAYLILDTSTFLKLHFDLRFFLYFVSVEEIVGI